MTKTLYIVVTILLSLGFSGSVFSDATIYLVRHAEKQTDGTRDPSLTEKGKERAAWIANYLADKDIAGIYSTDYRRTQQTAAPFAKQAGLSPQLYNPRALPDFADKLRSLTGNYLVVGHSNTTPALVSYLTNTEWRDLEDYQYDHIYIVKTDETGITARITYSEPRTNSFPEVAALKNAMVDRLMVMGDVARYKWNNGLPIESPDRETALMKTIIEMAVRDGMNTKFAREAAKAQLSASKKLQKKLYVKWQQQQIDKFESVPSLTQTIRPKIDALTKVFITKLRAAQQSLNSCEARAFFLHTPAALYGEEAVWDVATTGFALSAESCPPG